MVRGGSYRGSRSFYRGGGSSYRGGGSSYRGGGGSSYRGGGSRGSGGGRHPSSYDNRDKYSSREDYGPPKPSYRESYSSRDTSYRSPERKRPRNEGSSSRHDSYSSGSFSSSRYESHGPPSYERRHSGERYAASPYPPKREEFRKPPTPRGSYRGRISSRGSRGMIKSSRDRIIPRRRLVESSYPIRKRISTRGSYRSMKVSRIRSSAGIRRRRIPSDDEEEEKAVSSDEGKPPAKKEKSESESKAKKAADAEVAEGEETKTEAKEGNNDESELLLSETKKFVKLQCPHCHIKVLTFNRYEMHLRGKTHIMAMRRLSLKQQSILAQMRQAQRKSQNELEKEGKAETSGKTQFCLTCRLNYQTEKAVHQASESHKNMRKFLYPLCKVCGLQFKSPMMYENHLASIEHMKRKQKKSSETKSEASGDEDNLELEDFTTIDSVGEGVDETTGSGNEEEKKGPKEKKEPVVVGAEKVVKIEVHYCELCRMYLPRSSDDEEFQKILAKHCKQSVHIKRYVRMKENQELEKKAEKLQRKELAEKEMKKEADESKTEDEPMEEAKNDKEADATKEEDKLWEAVDKDLGELLGEADGAKSDEDDDDESGVNGERYDRFKLSSDKEKDGKNDEVEKMDVDEKEKPKAKPEGEKK